MFFFFLKVVVVRHEVGAVVRIQVFTVAILAQGTNRGDALCAALLSNRVLSILPHAQCFALTRFSPTNVTERCARVQ